MPVLYENRLYVPIPVGDDSKAINPKYECCKGRGAIVALDASTGEVAWTTYIHGDDSAGPQSHRNAALWAVRRVRMVCADGHRRQPFGARDRDKRRGASALSLDDGKVFWSKQLLAGDMGNSACLAADKVNCPEPHGPDYDFGSSPNLIALNEGRRF